MHKFSKGSRACSPGNFLNLDSLKCHFLDFGRDFTEFWWSENDIVTYQRPWPTFLLYRLSLGAPIWPIGVGGPRVLPVWAHSSYATESNSNCLTCTVCRPWWSGFISSDKINLQIFLVTKHRSLKIPSKVLSVFIMPHTVHSRTIELSSFEALFGSRGETSPF
jgi:hypothetical protein